MTAAKAPEPGAAPLGRLKYLYVGSLDAAKDIAHWNAAGAPCDWDHSDFGTRVAGLRVAEGPLWIVAGHRPPGILPVFAVADIDATLERLARGGWEPDEGPIEIPDGPCYLLRDPSGNQIAVVGEVRPWAEEHLRGSRP